MSYDAKEEIEEERESLEKILDEYRQPLLGYLSLDRYSATGWLFLIVGFLFLTLITNGWFIWVLVMPALLFCVWLTIKITDHLGITGGMNQE